MIKSTFYLVAILALCLLDGATAFVAQRPTSRRFAALQMADSPETPTPVAPPAADAAATPEAVAAPVAATTEASAAPVAATPEVAAAATPADTAAKPEAAPAASADKQSLYGTTLDLPDTYARCGACQTSFALTDDDLGDKGRGRYVTLLTTSLCGRSQA
jgi:hypothetical protein